MTSTEDLAPAARPGDLQETPPTPTAILEASSTPQAPEKPATQDDQAAAACGTHTSVPVVVADSVNTTSSAGLSTDSTATGAEPKVATKEKDDQPRAGEQKAAEGVVEAIVQQGGE